MANSGSFITTGCEGRTLTFSWSIQSQSIANNTTTISWNLKGSGTSGYVTCGAFKVVINGVTVFNKDQNYRVNVWQDTVVASGTHTIAHATDGSKTFSASASAGIYYYAPNCSGSGSWSLTAIPRATAITKATAITLGNKCNVQWTPPNSTFKYKLKFSLGKWSCETGFITPGTTSAYTYSGKTISGTETQNNTTIYKQLPNSPTGTMSVVLITYNSSGTKLGESEAKTFKVTIPDNVKPTLGSIVLDPTNITIQGTSYDSLLVQGKNALKITASGCSAGNGSAIDFYSFTGPSVGESTFTSATSCSATANSVTTAGTLYYTVRVTDKRGRYVESKQSITCYEYKQPVFKTLKFTRSGTTLTCTYNVEYSPIAGANKPTLNIYLNNSSTPTTIANLANGTVGSKSGSFNITLSDKDATYDVYAKVVDSLGTSISSKATKVFGAEKVFNAHSNGKGFAFGAMSSGDGFECAWNAKFYGDVSGPNGFKTSSDQRVKTDIQDISIDVVDNLRPIQYKLTKSADGKTHYGFIAQDVAQVLMDAELDPEATGIIGHVTQEGQQLYTLAYTEFIPLLVKKCQELQKENNEMRTEILEIKHMLLALNSE